MKMALFQLQREAFQRNSVAVTVGGIGKKRGTVEVAGVVEGAVPRTKSAKRKKKRLLRSSMETTPYDDASTAL